ncbi:hypothetical protein SAMN04515674_106159 [Pseudarcicella hirudinis]|uniref:Uncharacterized protein n=1 Tax=Pseudarcicella hirudinis TaxID=1079859 RepID=A0A1I5TQT3_9BACT|nr:hypothetical protein [Pseudarcicella hirudinis]SFP85419.1 hypothetical protein SAMN04515674_106159 [Pseudarcicella hirudinis]
MEISKIQQMSEAMKGLTSEEKTIAQQELMKALAKVDNLGELNEDTVLKIAGGLSSQPIGKIIDVVVGYIKPPVDPFELS